jgi:beta-phosphoglucomutase-like phosphatase (HAD superfamily)
VKSDEETVRNLVKKRIEVELEMSDQARLKAGALELLESLKRKVKLALASIKQQIRNRPQAKGM